MSTTTHELAYREAIRALDHQHATVAELRNRAGGLIATAAIAMSLLGQRGVTTYERPLVWISLACFGSLSACVLSILWPRNEWRFTTASGALVGYLLAHTTNTRDTKTVLHDLAVHLTADHRANSQLLTAISRLFRVGPVLLVTQVFSTLVAALAAG